MTPRRFHQVRDLTLEHEERLKETSANYVRNARRFLGAGLVAWIDESQSRPGTFRALLELTRPLLVRNSRDLKWCFTVTRGRDWLKRHCVQTQELL